MLRITIGVVIGVLLPVAWRVCVRLWHDARENAIPLSQERRSMLARDGQL